MITVLIFVLIAVVISLIWLHKHNLCMEDKALLLFVSITVTFMVSLFVACVIGEAATKIIRQNHHCYIYALGDDSKIQGSFTLGSGTIKEVEYFVFYSKDSYGYKYSKLPAYKCRVRETSGRPKLIKNAIEFKNPYTRYFAIEPNPEVQWVLNVPPGTIIKRFKLDLE